MILYKQRQSKANQESLLEALDELDKWSSSTEIKHYLDQKASSEDAQSKYSNGEFSLRGIEEHVQKNSSSMDLRTVQRWLAFWVKKGFVEKKHNKYLLSITGKRELRFRLFAQAYGTISLNAIMDCNFPTINTLEKNLSKLVEIFGIYIVNALIEATRLIVAEKNIQEEHWHSSYFGDSSNFRDGKFREGKLVNTWIKDIFNPWHMLNMFLTAVSNPADDRKTVPAKREEILVRERLKEYENDNPTEISGVSIDSILSPKRNNMKQNKMPLSTSDLMLRRVSEMPNFSQHLQDAPDINKFNKLAQIKGYYHYFKIRNSYDDTNLLYEPGSEKLGILKNSLKNQYPSYYKLLQKIDELFYSK